MANKSCMSKLFHFFTIQNLILILKPITIDCKCWKIIGCNITKTMSFRQLYMKNPNHTYMHSINDTRIINHNNILDTIIIMIKHDRRPIKPIILHTNWPAFRRDSIFINHIYILPEAINNDLHNHSLLCEIHRPVRY